MAGRRWGSRTTGYALLAALFLFGVPLLLATPAAAGPYPPTECATVSVSTTTPHAGEAMTVSGTGFTAGEHVTVELHSTPRDIGGATVGSDGTFSAQVTIPKDVYGEHQLVVVGGNPSCPVGPITVHVSASATAGEHIGPTGGLSSTGVQIALLIAIAAVALVTGIALARAGREKRSGA